MKKFLTTLASFSCVLTIILMMTACTPNTSAKMKERYEKNGYNVTVVISEEDNNNLINWQITATPKNNGETPGGVLDGIINSAKNIVTITSYKSTYDALKAYNSLNNVDNDKKFLKDNIVVYGFSSESVKIAK